MDKLDIKPEKLSPAKKWVPRPLVTVCGVCGSPATDVHHYGATSCYSCRAFFRRSIGSGKEYRYCSRKTDACVVDAVSRTNCKKCRFRKCLQVGMKPEKVDRVRKKNKVIKMEIKEEITENNDQSDSLSTAEVDFFLKLRDSRKDSESSYDSIASVDISALAEECIFEEEKIVDKNYYFNDPLPVRINGESIKFDLICKEEKLLDESGFFDNVEDNGFFDNPFPSVIYKLNPTFPFTFEEDFKIHELMVRKENLVDGIFQTIMELPNFLKSYKQFLLSINAGTGFVYKGPCNKYMMLLRKYVVSNFMSGGVIRQSLDMFDEYKYVDESVKTETFFFSMPVFHLCIRAILRANRNKETFVHQHRASGMFTSTVERACSTLFPNEVPTIASFDPMNVPLFASPWAARYEDEEFFSQTLETLGNIIKDDVKLGTLYCTLILATPGIHLSKSAQSDPALVRVQREMSLLIFRYLSHKFGNTHYASNTASALTKLLADLHICREIHMFGRLNVTISSPWEGNIEDLDI